jgi:uncharacterized membrane protein YpjA
VNPNLATHFKQLCSINRGCLLLLMFGIMALRQLYAGTLLVLSFGMYGYKGQWRLSNDFFPYIFQDLSKLNCLLNHLGWFRMNILFSSKLSAK